MDSLLNLFDTISLSTKVSVGIAVGMFLLGIILSEFDRRRGIARSVEKQNGVSGLPNNSGAFRRSQTKTVTKVSVRCQNASNSDDEVGALILLGLLAAILIGALIYFADYLSYVKQAVTWGSIAFLTSLMLMRHIQRNKYTKDALRRITLVRLVASVVNWLFLKFLSQHLDQNRNLSILHIAEAYKQPKQDGEGWIPKLLHTGLTFILSGDKTSLFALMLATLALVIFTGIYVTSLKRVATATFTYSIANNQKRERAKFWGINLLLVGVSAFLLYTAFDSGALSLQDAMGHVGENIIKFFDSLF